MKNMLIYISIIIQVRLVKNRDNNEIKGFVLICSIQASMESIHDSLAEALVNLTEEAEFPFFSLCYTFWMINVYITLDLICFFWCSVNNYGQKCMLSGLKAELEALRRRHSDVL